MHTLTSRDNWHTCYSPGPLQLHMPACVDILEWRYLLVNSLSIALRGYVWRCLLTRRSINSASSDATLFPFKAQSGDFFQQKYDAIPEYLQRQVYAIAAVWCVVLPIILKS